MKILTTYIPATEGTALVYGFSIDTQAMQVQKSIGYLPENNPLYLDMYVREYLLFNASIYKTPKNRVEEVIQQTGLTPEAHKKIEALSKGYRQRVGLANALLHDPEVLILDEPTTGLDPNQLLEIRELIKSVARNQPDGKAGKTVFLSTHIMQEVEAICDRVIIINQGKIVTDQNLSRLQDTKNQVIEVAFDFRVEEVALQRLPSLKKVENTFDFVYELTFTTQKDMRPAVFDFAHDNGLKILQLNQKNKNLEQLFRELTGKTD